MSPDQLPVAEGKTTPLDDLIAAFVGGLETVLGGESAVTVMSAKPRAVLVEYRGQKLMVGVAPCE